MPGLHWRPVATVLAVALLLLLAFATRGHAVLQPIAFNHRKHTHDLKLGCVFCHQYVSTGQHAGLPGASTCAVCHQIPQGHSPEAARVTELLSAGNPLEFHKLFRLPTYVYFSHRRHVGIAKLPCERCHGAIATTERPPATPLVKIRMAFCLDCHQASHQTVDCVACHR